MTAIDRNITITHEVMKARFDSNGKQVSDLYLWKHYRALVLENEQLRQQVDERPDPAAFDDDEHAMFLYGTGRF